MTIIVTGGAGFIGSNFVFHMLNKYPDYRIVCLDCLTYAGNLSTLEPVMDNPNFRFVKESITDREAVYKLFEEEKPDMVVNFAAESHVDRSIENPEVFLDTNIKGTAVLMDACRKYGIKRYHQVSTDEVYGDLPLDRPDLFFTEETPIHTSSPYSSSKAAADLLVPGSAGAARRSGPPPRCCRGCCRRPPGAAPASDAPGRRFSPRPAASRPRSRAAVRPAAEPESGFRTVRWPPCSACGR